MAIRASRTYKLKLSNHGVDLFLSCHCRLARMVGEFIPYGLTLYVAVQLLTRCDPSDIVAELESAACAALAGKIIRFVGTSPTLMNLTEEIEARLETSEESATLPEIWKLYNVALLILQMTEDEEVIQAYRVAAGATKVRRTSIGQQKHPARDA